MKTSHIFLIGAAVFIGVLGAQQVDHFLTARSVTNKGDLLPMHSETNPGIFRNAAFSGSAIPAAPFDFRAAAKKVNASVVSIDRFEKITDFFSDNETVRETGQGSGVIVSANGTIVTNNHVVADENGQPVQELKVRLSDNRTFTAKVLGNDPRSDLAVVKIDGPNLTPIELSNSSEVEVGQWVLAVGNPLGFSNTVSVGVVSSLKRTLPVGQQGLIDAVQTDAAINPGNSGGALCDSQGRLIGINSAIASGTGQSVGIGFAIPVDRVKTVVNDIVKYGYARYAGLGISYNGTYDLGNPNYQNALAQKLGVESVPNYGIIVLGLGGAASSSGIKQWDVILMVDGHKIERPLDLNQVLFSKKPGDKVSVKYWTHGKEKSATITLQELPGRSA
jgi:serine protease Do